jgi:hypothetical protein
MKLEDLPDRYRRQAERQLAVPHCPAIPAPDLERASGRPPVEAPRHPVVDTPCRVRVLCRRHRIADPDGISVKAVIDGLVLAGILAGDSTKEIVESPVITQVKVGRDNPETTTLEIFSAKTITEIPNARLSSLPR